MIKAVIFDVYETLVTVFDTKPYYSAVMAGDAGAGVEEFRKYWRSYEDARTIGKCDLSTALSGTLASLGIHDEELLSRMLQKRLDDQKRVFSAVRPEITGMLEALKAKGLKLGMLSNCYFEERDAIRASILSPYFDVLTLSCEKGMRKPDKGIFTACLDELGVQPCEALYVGDGGSMELEAADECGMSTVQACWFKKDDEPDQPCGIKEGFRHAYTASELLEYTD